MRACFLFFLILSTSIIACGDDPPASTQGRDATPDVAHDQRDASDVQLDAQDASEADASDASRDAPEDRGEDAQDALFDLSSDQSLDMARDDAPDTAPEAAPLVRVVGVFGGLRMHKQVPTSLGANRPLVVALHGCLQSAQTYSEVGWGELGQSNNFAVVYPEQPLGNRCFSWFNALDVRRDLGQARQIARMIDRMIEDHGIDPSRVYITGLSAGAAMTAAMAAIYPERFEAAAPIAGVPFGCAESLLSSTACLQGTRDWTSAQWAQKIFAQSGEQTDYPRISIWHGVDDGVVAPANAEHMTVQWVAVHGLSQTPTTTTQLPSGQTLTQHTNAQGEVVVERRLIERLGHGTPIDPDSDCGQPSAYVLARGICSTRDIGAFFGLVP